MKWRSSPELEDSDIDYVTGSAIRERVLRSLCEQSATSKELCERLDGSQSGIYAAATDLADQYLIERSDDKRWHPTSLGVVIADAISRQRRLESAIAADRKYWRRHDVTSLPTPFRETLHALGQCEVIRAPSSNPQRVLQRIHERVTAAEEVIAASPIHIPDYEVALTEAAERSASGLRLIIDRSVVREVYGDSEAVSAFYADIEVRILDIDVAVGVVDGKLLLSLPTNDGRYDLRSHIVSLDSDAVEWGEHLFEWYWNRATPAAKYTVGDSLNS